ncbi:MAG: alpha/beta hydrolase [Lentisphaerae bacterium]|jgi:acetyl esterase/lipase|nr:alpha/beta hydrolase [Lentisphaerota bacterium]
MKNKSFILLTILMAFSISAIGKTDEVSTNETEAASSPKNVEKPIGRGHPAPTHENLAYGDHERQVLDFWMADSETPTPVVVFMHGGGWFNGDKSGYRGVRPFLDAGISVAAINYRFIKHARAARVSPPVSWPMHDLKRAVQYLRYRAEELNIDKSRFGATGASAGACSALWLGLHDDMAVVDSDDPVCRESTRLQFIAVDAAQTSLDPEQMKSWIPNIVYGGHAFGFHSGGNYEARKAAFERFLENRESVLHWINEYSPYAQASSDDPPVYLRYRNWPDVGKPFKDATHSANFGVKLKERLDELGVPCDLVHSGTKDPEHDTTTSYLIHNLAK